MDTLAMGWSWNDYTDFNSEYPGSIDVTCTDCNGNEVSIMAGDDNTPDNGCEWSCKFVYSGELAAFFTLNTMGAVQTAVSALALLLLASA